jgi:lipopolysaccharide/colanic/teichoic acid biosynthesis glycosyltransferase
MLAESDACVLKFVRPEEGGCDRDVRPGRAGSATPVWKVAFDAALAAVGLVVGAPFLLLAFVLVKLTSRGPFLYSQTRLGLGGKPYTIYKVRTMAHNCESRSGARWSTPGDPRVTPVGRFLRQSKIDELPQLWNVLKGEMSLVGPRPERPEFVPQLERVIPHYRRRLEVRPGLTGLAQVQLPPDTDLTSVRRKLACDVWYVEHLSLWLDVRIVFATVGYVLKVPARLTCRLLGVPCGEPVQAAYERMAAGRLPAVEAV